MTISDIKYTSKDKAVVKDSLRDSTIWDRITPHLSDIIIASCYKSGTTLTQQIVNLLINGHDDFDSIHQLSPWVEEKCTVDSLNQKIERIEKLPDRRLFKTHLPFNALPYYPDWKYISLFRDGRDVAISLFNHLNAFTEQGRRNSPVYRDDLPSNFTDFWDDWVETGTPMWDWFQHLSSWWQIRDLSNVLLVHYNDLIHDKQTQIEKIAQFLDLEIDLSYIEMILHKSALEYMKLNYEKFEEKGFKKRQFIYKGTNERWVNLLSEQQIQRYEEKLVEKLGNPCAQWVKKGGKLP